MQNYNKCFFKGVNRICPVLRILLKNFSKTISPPPTFRNSACIESIPGDFPVFSLLIAEVIRLPDISPTGHFPDGHFPEDRSPIDSSPTDSYPSDMSPTRQFTDQTFPRPDIFPDIPDSKVPRSDISPSEHFPDQIFFAGFTHSTRLDRVWAYGA